MTEFTKDEPPEIAVVQFSAEHRFKHGLKFAQGKCVQVVQEPETHVRVINLAPQAEHPGLYDPAMVKGQVAADQDRSVFPVQPQPVRPLCDLKAPERRLRRFCQGLQPVPWNDDQVGGGYHASPRIPVHFGESVELLQERSLHRQHLLQQFPHGRLC